jgi:hypothetical protein
LGNAHGARFFWKNPGIANTRRHIPFAHIASPHGVETADSTLLKAISCFGEKDARKNQIGSRISFSRAR